MLLKVTHLHYVWPNSWFLFYSITIFPRFPMIFPSFPMISPWFSYVFSIFKGALPPWCASWTWWASTAPWPWQHTAAAGSCCCSSWAAWPMEPQPMRGWRTARCNGGCQGWSNDSNVSVAVWTSVNNPTWGLANANSYFCLYYILFVLIYSATVAHLLREVCLSISAVWGVPTTILVKTPKKWIVLIEWIIHFGRFEWFWMDYFDRFSQVFGYKSVKCWRTSVSSFSAASVSSGAPEVSSQACLEVQFNYILRDDISLVVGIISYPNIMHVMQP